MDAEGPLGLSTPCAELDVGGSRADPKERHSE